MVTADTTGPQPEVGATLFERVAAGRAALIPALVAVAVMLVWAAHDGGYYPDTWYWGALAMLGLFSATAIAIATRPLVLRRSCIVALAAFAGYVAWSYLSMAWSQTPAWALEGSNRALLYLLLFALFVILPWTAETALSTLLVFSLGVGAIAFLTLLRLASGEHVQQLVSGGRLVFPTGYFNSTVALFMMNALVAAALATRRQLPALLRGVLIAIASGSLQLCVMGQSRGWLFTFPIVVAVCIVVVPDRLRFAAIAVLPVVAALLPVHKLLNALQDQTGSALERAAMSVGRTSLLICAGVLVIGTLLASGEGLISWPGFTPARRRVVGTIVAVAVLLLAAGGADAATHGDPFGFVKRQWHGFIHPAPATAAASHFAATGSGRYDFWRVSLDALAAHPIGGLGQDNFADYYIKRRRTLEEPRWTHSVEMRLLAHTGVVGFGLFAAFLIAVTAVAFPALRRSEKRTRAVAAAAILPLVVWLIHGSVDWFWEFPALSGPAFAFAGLAAGLGNAEARAGRLRPLRRVPVLPGRIAKTLAFTAAFLLLAFPYLSVRELASATALRQQNPGAALDRLATAADLNPLSPDPGRIGGALALQTGDFTQAEKRFRQATSREPGGWFGWLGAGLAASALGDSDQARRDFRIATSINSRQPVIQQALAAVNSQHPLTPRQALRMLAAG